MRAAVIPAGLPVRCDVHVQVIHMSSYLEPLPPPPHLSINAPAHLTAPLLRQTEGPVRDAGQGKGLAKRNPLASEELLLIGCTLGGAFSSFRISDLSGATRSWPISPEVPLPPETPASLKLSVGRVSTTPCPGIGVCVHTSGQQCGQQLQPGLVRQGQASRLGPTPTSLARPPSMFLVDAVQCWGSSCMLPSL